MRRNKPAGFTDITPALLRRWPLPMPGGEVDKEVRGEVLVVAGAVEMPGAAILSAVAALRAGAGKLLIATPGRAAPLVAAAVPESRTVGLAETRGGALAASALAQLRELGDGVDAIVLGPGLIGSAASARMLARWIASLPVLPVVVDAAALDLLPYLPPRRAAQLILTPHAGEMARLLGVEKSTVQGCPRAAAEKAARRFDAVVAMKGVETWIVSSDADTKQPRKTTCKSASVGGPPGALRNRYGNPGLATSGSGDTLAGIIAGLAARGATPRQATAWGVWLHAAAGDSLAKRFGTLGFLARELLAEVPATMHALEPRSR